MYYCRYKPDIVNSYSSCIQNSSRSDVLKDTRGDKDGYRKPADTMDQNAKHKCPYAIKTDVLVIVAYVLFKYRYIFRLNDE